jgi:hypothetical protein
VVLELKLEPDPMRSMVGTLGEHAANMRSDGDEPKQVLFEQSLALVDISFREHPARRGELKRATF